MSDFTRLLSDTLVAVAARATNRYGKRDRNENNQFCWNAGRSIKFKDESLGIEHSETGHYIIRVSKARKSYAKAERGGYMRL